MYASVLCSRHKIFRGRSGQPSERYDSNVEDHRRRVGREDRGRRKEPLTIKHTKRCVGFANLAQVPPPIFSPQTWSRVERLRRGWT
jgi:hypothetical protein